MQNTYRTGKCEFAGIFEQRRTHRTYDVIFDAEEVSGSNPLSPTSIIPQMAQKWRISALLSGLFDTNRGLLQPSKRLNHNAVPTVLEKAPRVASTDSRERLPHRLHQGLAGSGLDFAEEVLYLGEGFFDGVKVRRVRRQVQELCSSLLEQCAHPLSLVS